MLKLNIFLLSNYLIKYIKTFNKNINLILYTKQKTTFVKLTEV